MKSNRKSYYKTISRKRKKLMIKLVKDEHMILMLLSAYAHDLSV